MQNILRRLYVLVGSACNFDCPHCIIDAHPKGVGLSEKEILVLIKTIRRYVPGEILFSGGEPTLYIREINKLIAAQPFPSKLKVTLATNGYFANTIASAQKTLSLISNLSRVQLSYDKFHEKFLPLKNVGNLYTACKRSGIDFTVLVVISSPMDLTVIEKLGAIGEFPIQPLKAVPFGRAADNGIGFVYPNFDGGVLRKRCPERRRIGYLVGKGFSMCCSGLAFGRHYRKFCGKTVEQFLASRFYGLAAGQSFGSLMKKFDIPRGDLLPKHSSECVLCEHIFNEAIKKGMKT